MRCHHDEIESGSYDLVHGRAIVMHMDDPVAVLRRLASALRPGGWLVVEDPDYGTVEAVDAEHPLAAAFDACYRARIEFLSGAGIMDLRYGRVLPLHMEALGLDELSNDEVARVVRGTTPLSRFWIETRKLTDDAMIANGLITEAAVTDSRRALEDPAFLYRSALLCSVWGRKPPKA